MLKKYLFLNRYKKYIIYIFCIFYVIYIFLFTNNVSAKWTCTIKEATAPVLENYIKDTKTVIKNITSWIINNIQEENNNNNNENNDDDSLENKLNNIWNKLKTDWENIIRIFGEAIDWEWFFSTFYYYAVFPITNEVPHQIQRDYTKLEKESEWLRKYLEKIVKEWHADIIIEDACTWVKTNCELKWKSMDIIWELIKNNSTVSNLFRQVVTLEPNTTNKKIILVSEKPDFKLEIEKNYWWDTIPNCSNEEGWFFEQIKEAISNITILNKEWEKWIEDWKQAWKMLIWDMDSDSYALEEKRILNEELDRQWLSTKNKDIILGNLKKYNDKWWFSADNNFIYNSFNEIKKVASDIKNTYSSIVSDLFIEETPTSSDSTSTDSSIINSNVQHFKGDKYEIEKSWEITKRIAEIFQKQNEFIPLEDINTEKTRAKIIKLHWTLVQGTKTLEETFPTSSKVCKEQDNWNWTCD